MTTILPWILAAAGLVLAAWFGWRLSRWRAWLASVTTMLQAGDEASRQAPRFTAPPLDATGDFTALLDSLRQRDQRSRKRLREESAEKALYQHLLDSIRHGVMILDDQLRIEFANRHAHESFPQAKGLRGRPLLEVTRDHRLHQLAQTALESRSATSAELRVSVAAPGPEAPAHRVFLAEAHPLRSRPLNGVWVMLVDITDRVMTEQIRKDFVANASHELRTPLTMLQGYIETLRDGCITDPEGTRRALNIMHKHSERILRLVEDMLTVSKLESNAVQLKLEPFSLADCFNDVVDHLRPLIDRTRARIKVDIPAGQPAILGDRFYFEQILINLVENALKNNPRGSLKVTLRQRSRDDHHEVSVIDNGVGIPQAEIPYIFKRFYRVERHHSSAVPGTGLGLTIVRRAVEAHRGRIEVRSVPGVETAFIMRFPDHPHEQPGQATEPAAALTGPPAGPRRDVPAETAVP